MSLIRTLLRRADVTAHTGESRSTLYSRIADGLFVPPVQLGPQVVAWPADEVAAIINARIAGKTDSEIKVLVQTLVNARQTAALPPEDAATVAKARIAGSSDVQIQALIKELEVARLAAA